jgi:hypothetical protein
MSNPKPKFAWFIKATGIAIISLMLVAAMRTAFSFGLSAMTSLNQFLVGAVPPTIITLIAAVEAFFSILGIEGFIIVTGMKAGMAKEEGELEKPRAIAVYILLLVSMAAGLFQNASLLNNSVLQASEWILMVITAVGVPVSLMLAAPYLGLMMNYQDMKTAQWLEGARESFNNTVERRVARKDLTAVAKAPLKVTRKEPGEMRHRANGTPGASGIITWYRQQHPEQEWFGAREAVREYLAANNLEGDEDYILKKAGAVRTALHREKETV